MYEKYHGEEAKKLDDFSMTLVMEWNKCFSRLSCLSDSVRAIAAMYSRAFPMVKLKSSHYLELGWIVNSNGGIQWLGVRRIGVK